MSKCTHGEGIDISIAGIPVDACDYELIQKVRNVTVEVLKCKKCGHIEIMWRRQENTEEGDE